MPSTYSSRLRFELIADGEQSGTWGQTTNRNTGTLVETAIAGYRTIAMPDSNYTLTTSNGLDDEARYAMLNFTGSLTATRDVIAPAVSKLYVVKNQTNQTLNVKTAAGAARAVLAGKTVMVFIDGTNAFDILNDLTSLSVSGATTLQAASATNLSYTGTLTGGTGVVNIGSGQIYKDAAGLVGIGTSTSLGNTLTLKSNETIGIANASLAVGQISGVAQTRITSVRLNGTFASDMRLAASDAGGTMVDHFTLTNAGNVGIGTATPLFSLHVNKNAVGEIIHFTGANNTKGSLGNHALNNGGVYLESAQPNQDLRLRLQGVDRFFVDSAGNAGLAVVPSAWDSSLKSVDLPAGSFATATAGNGVIVARNAFFNGSNWIYRATETASRYEQGVGQHQWFTAPSGTAGNPITFTQAATLFQNGNFALNRTSTVFRLDVAAADGNVAKFAFDGGDAALDITSPTGNTIGITAAVGDTLTLGANAAEAARITSTRYFKASNTGVYGNVAGLGALSTSIDHVIQSDQDTKTLRVVSSSTGANVNNVSSALATGSAGFHFEGLLNNVLQYRVLANGNVQNTNNSYGAISDSKLKENVVDASSYLDRYMQVRFRNFNFIGSDLKQFGVIAQELETVFPGLVEETPDTEQVTKTRIVDVPAVLDEEGAEVTPATTREEEYTESVPTGTVTKSVKYSILAQIQGKVIQEQQVIIQQMKAEVADQQKVIDQQKAQIDSILARLTALEAK